MKCSICSSKITKKNNGFSTILNNNDERKRLLKINKKQTVCLDCKFTVMALDIISPF